MLKAGTTWILALSAVICTMTIPFVSKAEVPQEWTLVDPSCVIRTDAVKPAPRLSTLEGKTIVLHWNGKPNGNIVLDRIAEHLAQRVPSATIVKAYEKFPEIVRISATQEKSAETGEKLLSLKPDLVIGSTAD